MSRYYLHVRDGSSELLDPEGAEFIDMAGLRKSALAGARELMAAGIADGVLDLRFRIDAEDDGGHVVYSLPFDKAATIIPAAEG
jgi:hypothetical protein